MDSWMRTFYTGYDNSNEDVYSAPYTLLTNRIDTKELCFI